MQAIGTGFLASVLLMRRFYVLQSVTSQPTVLTTKYEEYELEVLPLASEQHDEQEDHMR